MNTFLKNFITVVFTLLLVSVAGLVNQASAAEITLYENDFENPNNGKCEPVKFSHAYDTNLYPYYQYRSTDCLHVSPEYNDPLGRGGKYFGGMITSEAWGLIIPKYDYKFINFEIDHSLVQLILPSWGYTSERNLTPPDKDTLVNLAYYNIKSGLTPELSRINKQTPVSVTVDGIDLSPLFSKDIVVKKNPSSDNTLNWQRDIVSIPISNKEKNEDIFLIASILHDGVSKSKYVAFDNLKITAADYAAADSDGDGITDKDEGTGDIDGDGTPNFLDTDSDGDGISDFEDLDYDNDGVSNYDENKSNDLNPYDPYSNGSTQTDGEIDSDSDGITNDIESDESLTIITDTDDDGTPNFLDTDSDGDGISDADEGTTDTDNDGIPNYTDTDSDGDGIRDADEGTSDIDNDGAPNYLDLDADGDGTLDKTDLDYDDDGVSNLDELESSDLNPYDPYSNGSTKTDGEIDSDGDGITNDIESDESLTTITDSDGDGIPDYLGPDSDGDGITDRDEGTGDIDGDGIPNFLDTDSDGDGTFDKTDLDYDNDGVSNLDELESTELSPYDPYSNGATKTDGEIDSDGDGITNDIESDESLETITDTDNDGIADYLDLDADGDGISDADEGTGDIDEDGTPNYLDLDSDGDSILDKKDLDYDNDGVSNLDELESTELSPYDPYSNGATKTDGEIDSDGDGITNDIESDESLKSITDTDNDGIADYLDLDADGDGISDADEGTDDIDEDGTPNYLDLDSDGDGINDQIEGTIDTDSDGVPSFLDTDSDNDRISDKIEGTGDSDGDSIPNYRDLDSDGDDISDADEGIGDIDGDGTPNHLDTDSDGDGTPDNTDLDYDNDGVSNLDELESTELSPYDPYSNGATKTDGEIDSDGDGITNDIESDESLKTITDTDNDGIADYLDLDADGDGISDADEGTDDIDEDGIPNYLDLDSDNDRISDKIEGTIDTDSDGVPNYIDTDSDNDRISDKIEGTIDTDSNGVPNYIDKNIGGTSFSPSQHNGGNYEGSDKLPEDDNESSNEADNTSESDESEDNEKTDKDDSESKESKKENDIQDINDEISFNSADDEDTVIDTFEEKKVSKAEIMKRMKKYDSCAVIDKINNPKDINSAFSDAYLSKYRDSIVNLEYADVVDGRTNSFFAIDDSVTRTEFIKMVLRAHCQDYSNQNTKFLYFDDVDKNSWNAKVIAKAIEIGIVDKNTSGNFYPNKPITRLEATKILMNTSFHTFDDGLVSKYLNISKDSWENKYIAQAEQIGLYNSQENSEIFQANQVISRDVLTQYLEIIVNLYDPSKPLVTQ